MTAGAGLSAASTALDELIGRLATISAEMTRDEHDALDTELFEVERNLRAAHRRLVRALDTVR